MTPHPIPAPLTYCSWRSWGTEFGASSKAPSRPLSPPPPPPPSLLPRGSTPVSLRYAPLPAFALQNPRILGGRQGREATFAFASIWVLPVFSGHMTLDRRHRYPITSSSPNPKPGSRAPPPLA